MLPSMPSDSSKTEQLLTDLINELLESLDRARNLDDLYQSLKAQHYIIEALLILLEKGAEVCSLSG
jgi:hypothetical protein